MPSELTGIEAIFIDDGGVMNDNERRGQQFRKHLADYLVPRFGGTHAAWEAANLEIISVQMPMYVDGTGFPERGGFLERVREMDILWWRGMCEIVGVEASEDDDECYRISREATEYVIPRIRSYYPGAPEAIRALHAAGYRLYTASGEESYDLALWLDGLGVRELITRAYGPDLIDTHKGSRYYYEGIFADSGESPATALFLDDSNKCIGWITEAGARGVLVTSEPPDETDAVAVIGSLAELPELLAEGRQATE